MKLSHSCADERKHLKDCPASGLLSQLASIMTSLRSTRTTPVKKTVSLLCLVIFLFLQALATVPELHQYFHHDANQASHQCAVTLLTHGSLHVAGSLTVVISSPAVVGTLPAHIVSAPLRVDYLLLPGRAPPASILS